MAHHAADKFGNAFVFLPGRFIEGFSNSDWALQTVTPPISSAHNFMVKQRLALQSDHQTKLGYLPQ